MLRHSEMNANLQDMTVKYLLRRKNLSCIFVDEKSWHHTRVLVQIPCYTGSSLNIQVKAPSGVVWFDRTCAFLAICFVYLT